MSITSSKQPLFHITIITITITIIINIIIITPVHARNAHVINFRSPNLYPESLTWDPHGQHFLLGSLRHRHIAAVSDAGVVQTFTTDTALPDGASILGLAVDSHNNRLLAVIAAEEPLPPFNALAAYDLRTRRRIFLSHLPADDRAAANDVAVDHSGNAFVTNSAGNFIWKVTVEGEASIFSKSPLYADLSVDREAPNHRRALGLNGIAYVSKGYLLVVQSSTGRMFKVDADDGTARRVLLSEDLVGADDVAVRGDGVVVVVSPVNKLWFLKSQDSWAEGVVFDKVEVDLMRFPTSVVVGERDRVYVLYGHLNEGRMIGNYDDGRESFGIAEVRSKKEGQDENVWVFVLIGVGLVYFFLWRFQMGQLVKKMNRKIN